MRRAGPYQLQAAIAALHAEAPTAAATDWPQIVGPVRMARRAWRRRRSSSSTGPSPSRCADGPAAGLALLDELVARRRARRLPPAPRGPRRPAPPPRPAGRGGCRLPPCRSTSWATTASDGSWNSAGAKWPGPADGGLFAARSGFGARRFAGTPPPFARPCTGCNKSRVSSIGETERAETPRGSRDRLSVARDETSRRGHSVRLARPRNRRFVVLRAHADMSGGPARAPRARYRDRWRELPPGRNPRAARAVRRCGP